MRVTKLRHESVDLVGFTTDIHRSPKNQKNTHIYMVTRFLIKTPFNNKGKKILYKQKVKSKMESIAVV